MKWFTVNNNIQRTMFLFILLFSTAGIAQTVLVEAESFSSHGGWKLDTQFIDTMGSPYLLAHGLGRSVEDATTEVTFPETGTYQVYVRTKDWVARWEAPGQPGRFQLIVNGTALEETFGTQGADWHWHDGGTVQVDTEKVTLSLHDLTGFDGRCDAILFTKEEAAPPNETEILPSYRRELLGLPEEPVEKGVYDLVVIGGGYSGLGAAISAARMGCKVALIQNRGVLGGNGSSEVRVWAKGNIRRGIYPRVGEIIAELADSATKSPGTYEEFEDAKKLEIVEAEPNIDLFLHNHAFKVEKEGDRITAVYTFDTRTSAELRFTGKFFADCTGHGTIGVIAGADWDMSEKGRMGMSNMWRWEEIEDEVPYPDVPWALNLEMDDFPYPRNFHGEWFWESGFDINPIDDAEGIRDWNLRAVYGSFNAMKNKEGASKHKNAQLSWIAYIGGPRESRRLMGDVILTQEDLVAKREFPDGCVPSTWSIDLHYPKEQYTKKYPENPFISYAVHDRRVDPAYGYPLPYRCFYSRNVENLFMAGRNISVTHQALGTVRVMQTCGMMGEVVGRAVSICVEKNVDPGDIYPDYWSEMDALLKLPGKARRLAVEGVIMIPDDAMELASSTGPPTGLEPSKLEGHVIDDQDAERIGKWTQGTGLAGYVGRGYHYAGGDSGAKMRFKYTVPEDGTYYIRVAYQPHENRGTAVPVRIVDAMGTQEYRVNMQKAAPMKNGFIQVGKTKSKAGDALVIEIGSDGAKGTVHGDAVQIIRKKR